jgi:hypothetical protein
MIAFLAIGNTGCNFLTKAEIPTNSLLFMFNLGRVLFIFKECMGLIGL